MIAPTPACTRHILQFICKAFIIIIQTLLQTIFRRKCNNRYPYVSPTEVPLPVGLSVLSVVSSLPLASPCIPPQTVIDRVNNQYIPPVVSFMSPSSFLCDFVMLCSHVILCMDLYRIVICIYRVIDEFQNAGYTIPSHLRLNVVSCN